MGLDYKKIIILRNEKIITLLELEDYKNKKKSSNVLNLNSYFVDLNIEILKMKLSLLDKRLNLFYNTS